MPSQTIAGALINLWMLDLPWNFPRWQEITDIRQGLFPEDDRFLPKIGKAVVWTRHDSQDVLSFFEQYKNLSTDAERTKFITQSRGAVLPGRNIWVKFVAKGWPRWNVHGQIINQLNLHDIHPLKLMLSENTVTEWPAATLFLPEALDDIGVDLFGPEALSPTSGRLPIAIRECIRMLSQQTWLHIRKQVERSRNKIEVLERDALELVSDINQSTPTKAEVRKAIRAVGKWRNMAEVLCTEDNLSKIDSITLDLNITLKSLGILRNTGTKGKGKQDRKSLLLATEDDILDLQRLYSEYFDTQMECDPVLETAIPFGAYLSNEGSPTDLGLELEAHMSPDSISSALGFHGGRPFLFNHSRHSRGFSAWANPALFEDQHSPDLQPLLLHPHQLSGLHSIIRTSFSPSPVLEGSSGKLIADEVGLGKTAIVIATIAFLSHMSVLQLGGKPLPPILTDRIFLGRRQPRDLCDSPHLIAVPGTLLAQWESELRLWFLPKKVDIVSYCGKMQHDDLWGPDGLVTTSKHKSSSLIILTTHSMVQREFSTSYLSEVRGSRKGKLPWVLPPKKPDNPQKTLFQHEYYSITIDEAHLYRNVGPKYFAAITLLERAQLRLILTATPLHTSTKDIASMGRLVGIPHFSSNDAYQEEKDDHANLRRAKKAVLEEDLMSDKSPEKDQLRLLQVSAAMRMARKFGDRILRRTASSKDWEGKPLLDLPPFKTVLGVLRTTDREMDIILRLAEAAKENVAVCVGDLSRFLTKKFYLEYRMAVGYAKDSDDEEIPHFKTLEAWGEKKSTKMDVCARICQYLLQQDDLPEIEFKNGHPIFTPLTPSNQHRLPSQETRILIYQEFSSLCRLLRNVLSLYGVTSLFIDGHMSFEKRYATVNRFHEKNAPRVLIFSSVGSAGLNLSLAHIVIFLDQPWSAQDERQIRGRAHRQPQQKEVICYHLLAEGTADMLVSSMAHDKHDMLEAFLSKDAGRDMMNILSGVAPAPTEGDDDEDKVKKPQKSKAAPKKKLEKSQKPMAVPEKKPGPSKNSNSQGSASVSPTNKPLSTAKPVDRGSAALTCPTLTKSTDTIHPSQRAPSPELTDRKSDELPRNVPIKPISPSSISQAHEAPNFTDGADSRAQSDLQPVSSGVSGSDPIEEWPVELEAPIMIDDSEDRSLSSAQNQTGTNSTKRRYSDVTPEGSLEEKKDVPANFPQNASGNQGKKPRLAVTKGVQKQLPMSSLAEPSLRASHSKTSVSPSIIGSTPAFRQSTRMMEDDELLPPPQIIQPRFNPFVKKTSKGGGGGNGTGFGYGR